MKRIVNGSYHYHLALTATIELAKKNSLPASEQQLSIVEKES